MNDRTRATRLHLGASRLEDLDPKRLGIFLDKSWMHLGDAESARGPAPRHDSPDGKTRRAALAMLYECADFRPFYYRHGQKLPFKDRSFGFIFSEHFFEHLFLHEAVSLLKECRRVLKKNGVIRTCVPDADLRTYEPPEPIGYPDKKMRYDHPAKHKTRWSVHSLTEALELSGFRPVPLRWCDVSGRYHTIDPLRIKRRYAHCPDRAMIFDLGCIKRIDSLIVDGIRHDGGGRR